MNTKDKINRFSKVFMIISLLCVGFLRDIEGSVSAATDYSSEVVIDDFDILDSNGVALSATNPAKHGANYQLSVNWTLTPTGNVLHEGDTLKFRVPQNSQIGFWYAGPSAFVDFVDATGTAVGQWRMNSSWIEVVFNSEAEGVSTISATFVTGKSILSNSTMVPSDIVQDVSMGEVTKQIKFLKRDLAPLSGSDSKFGHSPSNSQITWNISTNTRGVVELGTNDLGTDFTIQKNVYVEDVLEKGTNINTPSFYTYIFRPVDTQTLIPSSNSAYIINITSYFTKVDQSTNETYEQFKSRLNVFEYGVYTDKTGIDTFVVYYGDIGNNGLKYSEVDENFAVQSTTNSINSGYYTSEGDADVLNSYYEQVYGDSNVINGQISNIYTTFRLEYDKVLLTTNKTNTATITKNGVSTQYTGTQSLQGNFGTTSMASSAAGLYLYDEETGVLLEGGTFKVQYNNNGTWEDYSSAGILTTDEEGFLQTPTLGAGTYRFIQLSASDEVYNLVASQGYDSSLGNVISAEFTINPLESEGEIVEVSNIKHRYDVVYTSGEYGTFEDDEHLEVVALSQTPGYDGELCDKGNPIGEEGYDFVGWDKEISPLVTSSAVYVAQWEVATVDDPAEDPGSENNPEQVGTSTPDGGLETSPFGMLAVLMVGGFSLVFRMKK